MSDMRDRLIEILDDFGDDISLCDICERPNEDCNGCQNEQLADYLIANGVILSPCKVGKTMYIINSAGKIQEMKFDTVDLRITCARDDDCMCGSLCGDIAHNICQHRFNSDFSEVGKTVFLTREEAERALKGGAANE